MRSEPDVKYKTLNAWWNFFEKQPQLKGDEKGVTKSNFLLTVRYQFDVVKKEQSPSQYSVTIKPTRTLVQLALPITIWTPWGAPEKLHKHEEGHRQIAERVYEEAEDIARYFAGSILEKSFDGRGGSEAEAIENAYSAAAKELNESYRNSVFEYSRCVNQEYDRITKRGLEELDEKVAVNRAFEKFADFLSNLNEERRAKEREKQVKTPMGPVTPLTRGADAADDYKSSDKVKTDPSAVKDASKKSNQNEGENLHGEASPKDGKM